MCRPNLPRWLRSTVALSVTPVRLQVGVTDFSHNLSAVKVFSPQARVEAPQRFLPIQVKVQLVALISDK